MTDQVWNGVEEMSGPGNDELSFWRRGRLRITEQPQDVRSGDARGDAVNRGVGHGSVPGENEHRRLGNTALFTRVVNAPPLHYSSLGIAQDRERQTKLLADNPRIFCSVHGNGGKMSVRGADCRLQVAKSRQLAETESSPISSIEQQNESP